MPVLVQLALALFMALGAGALMNDAYRDITAPPPPEAKVVTSDGILSDYIKASNELLGRWSFSKENNEVVYQSDRYRMRFRAMGLLDDTMAFDPMKEFASQARMTLLNEPASRRNLSFDYRATMHDEKVGPELYRAMSFLRDAKVDASGNLTGVDPRAIEEVQTIYRRVAETQMAKEWAAMEAKRETVQ